MASFIDATERENPVPSSMSRSPDSFLKFLQFSLMIPFYSTGQMVELFHPGIVFLK